MIFFGFFNRRQILIDLNPQAHTVHWLADHQNPFRANIECQCFVLEVFYFADFGQREQALVNLTDTEKTASEYRRFVTLILLCNVFWLQSVKKRFDGMIVFAF